MQLISVQDPLKIVQHAIWELPSRVKWIQWGFCLPAAPSHTEAAIPMCPQLNIAAAPQNDRRAPSPGSQSLLRALLIWMSTKQPSKHLGRTVAGDRVQQDRPSPRPPGNRTMGNRADVATEKLCLNLLVSWLWLSCQQSHPASHESTQSVRYQVTPAPSWHQHQVFPLVPYLSQPQTGTLKHLV